MFVKVLTTIWTVCCFSFHYGVDAKYTVTCYYDSREARTFPPSDIDCSICTIINYYYLHLDFEGRLHLGGVDGAVDHLRSLKGKCPKVKLVFSIAEPTLSKEFSEVSGNPNKRQVMAKSALEFLKRYDFDGIDINWEHPAHKGGRAADKENLVELLRTLRYELRSVCNRYLLTLAATSIPYDSSYDVKSIASYVDYINLKTYIFYGCSDKTSYNTPLYAGPEDAPWERENENCLASITNWKNKGAPANKLVLGLAFFGVEYTLQNPNDNKVGAPTNGSVTHLSYRDICKKTRGWTQRWDNYQRVPYALHGYQWISYDNRRSISEKVQLAKREQLAGVMIWAVNLDDHEGACGERLPLLKEIRDNL